MKNVKQTVLDILKEKLGLSESVMTMEASFIKDLGVDSLDYIELIMAFEQAFNINIPDTDAEKMRTIGAAIDYIEERLAEAQNEEEKVA
ncbi:MAG: acyl carrier protein [Raineya sp.]